MTPARITRRALLQGGLAAGAGLTIGFDLGRARRVTGQAGGVFAPSVWLRIDRDGVVTIQNSESEMGQGTLTSMAMIIADELDADWSKVRVEQAPVDPSFGSQMTVGSASIRGKLTVWRRAGAAAREMLVTAAAREWGVPVAEVDADQGKVTHRPSGRVLTYGELADKAAQVPVPQSPKLKTPDRFTLIGKNVARLSHAPRSTSRGPP